MAVWRAARTVSAVIVLSHASGAIPHTEVLERTNSWPESRSKAEQPGCTAPLVRETVPLAAANLRSSVAPARDPEAVSHHPQHGVPPQQPPASSTFRSSSAAPPSVSTISYTQNCTRAIA